MTLVLRDRGAPLDFGTAYPPRVAELIRLRKPAEVVLVADVDEPGRRGAERLASGPSALLS